MTILKISVLTYRKNIPFERYLFKLLADFANWSILKRNNSTMSCPCLPGLLPFLSCPTMRMYLIPPHTALPVMK